VVFSRFLGGDIRNLAEFIFQKMEKKKGRIFCDFSTFFEIKIIKFAMH
jgi:hypothetical protein